MSHHRMSSVFAVGFVCIVIAVSSAAPRTASAQDLDASDNPFGEFGLESMKKKGATPKRIEKIFDNGNIYAVQNRPTRATVITLDGPTRIAKITTYHWNDGRGAPAGTIALRSSSGKTFGPWQASGQPGQGGVPSAYWIVEPDISLPAGSYTVIDSNPATWAQNDVTAGVGMAWAEGYIE